MGMIGQKIRLIRVRSKCHLWLDHSNGRRGKGQGAEVACRATIDLQPATGNLYNWFMSNPEKWHRFAPLPADIAQRLQALPTLLAEKGVIVAYLFGSYGLRPGAHDIDLALQWIVERGLIAAAALILDIADYMLAEKYSLYPNTYEESLLALKEQQIISNILYQQIKGLGGFRNILVHVPRN